MPRINQEEYEVLKELDDKWKWIARDGECNSLNVFSVKPIKVHSQWDYMDVGYKHTGLTKEENKMFQFIQWEDSEPYNIQELIEEYENEEFGYYIMEAARDYEQFVKESEETEVKKDVEWLKEEINQINPFIELTWTWKRKVLDLINQLDEPEVSSQEEVDQAYKDGYEKGKQHTFYKGYLEGLTDKENEPETVADVVTTFWKSFERLKEVMSMEVEELEE